MEVRSGAQSIPSEFPYFIDEERDPLELCRPSICRRCGSVQTTSYVRLMVANNVGDAISGDLIFHPIEVVICMTCQKTSYRNYQTMRDC